MVHYRYPSGGRVRRKNRRSFFLTAALVAISMSPVAFFANWKQHDALPTVEAPKPVASASPAQDKPVAAPSQSYDWELINPKPTLQAETHTFTHNAPLATAFRSYSVAGEVAAPASAPVQQAAAQPPQPQSEMKVAEATQPVPLPVPRPAEFRIRRPTETTRMASAPAAPAPTRSAALQPASQENAPSFFEKFFGIKPATPPEAALSYAAVNTDSLPSSRLSPAPSVGEGTAVYDISAKVVIMPNGERLEAHSGLGDKLDDPRYVHVRMKGATPPGTYILKEREALFHGVRAIRLTPVGGSGAIYGRDGILAHTYMLGPNGDSNGCVSFRDYDKFLHAYLRGEVKRLVVVAGRGQDALPRMVNNRG